jgi:hypothetical protein
MTKQLNAKGSAPGQYLGYAIQPVRFFYYLLTCDSDCSVGLEVVDDVSVHRGNIPVLVEQCKSALTSNPTTDWNEDLWKTFSNWCSNSTKNFIEPEKTKFRFYVTPNKVVGKFAKRLSDVTSDAEIKRVLDDIEIALNRRSKPPACIKHIRSTVDTNIKLLYGIIRNFNVNAIDQTPLDSIYNAQGAYVPVDSMENVTSYGIGLAKGWVDEKISRGEPAIISAKEFRKKFRAFVRQNDASGTLHSLALEPNDDVIKDVLSSAPIFVTQHRLIGSKPETITRATSDYLWASANRTKWADEGKVYDGSFDPYEDALIRRHANIDNEVSLTHSSLRALDRGAIIYNQCCRTYPIPLEGMVVPEHFLPGTLNQLADRLKIGWHPDYKLLIKEKEDDE